MKKLELNGPNASMHAAMNVLMACRSKEDSEVMREIPKATKLDQITRDVRLLNLSSALYQPTAAASIYTEGLETKPKPISLWRLVLRFVWRAFLNLFRRRR